MEKRVRFMTDLIAPMQVAPGSTVKLSRDHDPGHTGRLFDAMLSATSTTWPRGMSSRPTTSGSPAWPPPRSS
jgi:hypothetical protein